MTASRLAPSLAGLLLAACAIAWVVAWRGGQRPGSDASATAEGPAAPAIPYEQWARAEFTRRHPGEKPLNWRIARKAEEFVRLQPMGRFVLHRNDCSDFTDCILDDALGARARFRRNSTRHLLAPEISLWEFYRWEPGSAILPGDEIAVRHSPHYPPYPESPWHRGIVGTDGRVYDWTKLRSWSSDRYGRHTVAWFLRHSRDRNEVILRRLRPAYRYRIESIPLHGVPKPQPSRDGKAAR